MLMSLACKCRLLLSPPDDAMKNQQYQVVDATAAAAIAEM